MPKVSIIVPVYNTEKYLQRCVDSLLHQTLTDTEIILVDDGSKEPCAQLCDKLAATDERIRVVHKANGGLGYARNTGLAAATGEYVGFVDSDDYIAPAMYESLCRAADVHKADLVVSGICFVGGNTFSQSGDYEEKPYFDRDTVFAAEDLKTLLLGVVGALPHEKDDSRYGVSVCKNLFRTSLLREKNIEFLSEREILSEDTLFMVDVLQNATCAVGIPGAYYCYCRNDDSLSKSYNPQRFEKSMVFLKALETKLKETLSQDEYRLYLDRLTQGFGRILCSQEIVHAKDVGTAFPVLRRRLKEICTCAEIRTVLKTYPWHRLPVKQAAFAFTMKYQLYFLQKVLVLLRDR